MGTASAARLPGRTRDTVAISPLSMRAISSEGVRVSTVPFNSRMRRENGSFACAGLSSSGVAAQNGTASSLKSSAAAASACSSDLSLASHVMRTIPGASGQMFQPCHPPAEPFSVGGPSRPPPQPCPSTPLPGPRAKSPGIVRVLLTGPSERGPSTLWTGRPWGVVGSPAKSSASSAPAWASTGPPALA